MTRADRGRSRELPGHIAAALAGAGGAGDSAGVPWEGRNLADGDAGVHAFPGDDGQPDAALLAAWDDLASGRGGESGIVRALAAARVFVPVVASLVEEAEGVRGHAVDQQADMALVTITAPDGRTALPAFTSPERLVAWHPDARPVAVFAPRAALSAVAEGAQLMVLDPGASRTFVVRRPALWALARQRAWTPSYQDPGLVSIVAEATDGLDDAVRGVHLEAGAGVASRDVDGRILPGGGAGPELRIVVELRPGLPEESLHEIVAELNRRLSSHEGFAEAVDTLEVRIRASGS